MKSLIITTVLFANSLAFASVPLDQQIGSVTVTEVTNKQVVPPTTPVPPTTTPTIPTTPPPTTPAPTPVPTPTTTVPTRPPMTPQERLDYTGKIIDQTKNLVALGESIYTLVQKGKPKNTTEYTPVTVTPKDPMTKEYVDPFDLEGFSVPEAKTFKIQIKNKVGKTVVNFVYKVVYSYGGSYNGAGKYITGVNIIPASVKTRFGWDFASSMKVTGIMNHGSKDSPIAGVMITIKYSANSWGSATERNDTVHITGDGKFRAYINN